MLNILKRKEKATGESDKSNAHHLKNSDKQEAKPNSSIFEGMEEPEVHALYSYSTIQKLQAGDTLYKEEDIADSLHLILKGQLRILKNIGGTQIGIDVLREGDWILGVDFTKQNIRTDSAIALKPAAVMTINKNIFSKLDVKIQLSVFKKLQRIAAQQISKLASERDCLKRKNQKLTADIFSIRCKGKNEFIRSEMVQDLIKKIPRLPVSTNTLMHKLQDDETSANEAAELVKQDPSLTGMVLKTINSSYYNFRQKISDVNHAIVLLGFNRVYQMVMAESMRQSLPNLPIFQELYVHSQAISHISFAICQVSQTGKPSEMATIGLLHDIGQVVIELLKRQNPKLVMLIDSLDRAEMGSTLLRTWNIPDSVCQSIEFQKFPEFSPVSKVPDEAVKNVTILYLSHLCYDSLQNNPMDEELSPPFLVEYLRLLKWEHLSVQEIISNLILPTLRKQINVLPKPLIKQVNDFGHLS